MTADEDLAYALARGRHFNMLSTGDTGPFPIVSTHGETRLLVNSSTPWEDVERLRAALMAAQHGIPRRNNTPCLDDCGWCKEGDPRREG